MPALEVQVPDYLPLLWAGACPLGANLPDLTRLEVQVVTLHPTWQQQGLGAPPSALAGLPQQGSPPRGALNSPLPPGCGLQMGNDIYSKGTRQALANISCGWRVRVGSGWRVLACEVCLMLVGHQGLFLQLKRGSGKQQEQHPTHALTTSTGQQRYLPCHVGMARAGYEWGPRPHSNRYPPSGHRHSFLLLP